MPKQSNSAWMQYLLPDISDEALVERMRIPLPILPSIEQLDLEDATRTLRKHLDSVYEPTDQDVQVVRRVLGEARSHVRSYYEDERAFVGTINSVDYLDSLPEPSTTIITSEAGVGKTSLSGAIQRVLGPTASQTATPDCGPLPIIGGVFFKAHTAKTSIDMLNLIHGQLGGGFDFKRADVRTKQTLRRKLYREGCFFLVMDEIQSITQGKGSGAHAVQMLHMMRELKVPSFAIGNYNFGHRLMAQHDQDMQRFTHRPVIMFPEHSEHKDFIAYLKALRNSCGELLSFDPETEARAIHWMSNGVKRIIVSLIELTYSIERESKRGRDVKIGVEEMRSAYMSTQFSAFRTRVELVRSHLEEGKKIREDLRCPFDLTDKQAQQQLRLAADARKARLNLANLMDSITPDDRAGQQADQSPSDSTSLVQSDAVRRPRSVAAQGRESPKRGAVPKPKASKPSLTQEDVNRDWGDG
ncbi:hypothetical protein HNP55_001706 [Paucibacter oligotrophus]|uniref:TniB protein n=1 Tax=Roseateles oligotrophus TaxID=1769250 RepID=A0A840LCY9_9BURK|nr:hypothetical protein [Roseateles oligotrophus]MBB4843187.1 hypothetical protein [Roseateles oligotrophus]